MPKGYSKGRKQFKRTRQPRPNRVCGFCQRKIEYIDYKQPELLKRFINRRGKILPRFVTGACAKHQRKLAHAIKRARVLALLPFAQAE